MARKNYKSYGNYSLSRRHRRRNIQWFIVAMVVLVVLLTILLKDKGEKEPVAEKDIKSVNPVLPENIEIDKKEPVVVKSPVKKPVVKAKPKIVAKAVEKPVIKVVAPEVKPIAKINKPLSEADLLMNQAFAALEKSDYISARNILNEVLAITSITPEQRSRVKKQMAKMSEVWMKVAFPGDPLTGSYQVKSGDNLEAIGKRHNVPAEFLMKINGIKDARKLQAEQNLKVVNGPFNAIVYKSRFEMDLYLQNTYVKTFKIGIGLPGKDTPTGNWRVTANKKIGPPWTRPQDQGGGVLKSGDPENPLGVRWIPITCFAGDGLNRTGFGIHGNNAPESIGTQCSLGCIRMHNDEVVEFYNMVIPSMSIIYIRD